MTPAVTESGIILPLQNHTAELIALSAPEQRSLVETSREGVQRMRSGVPHCSRSLITGLQKQSGCHQSRRTGPVQRAMCHLPLPITPYWSGGFTPLTWALQRRAQGCAVSFIQPWQGGGQERRGARAVNAPGSNPRMLHGTCLIFGGRQ